MFPITSTSGLSGQVSTSKRTLNMNHATNTKQSSSVVKEVEHGQDPKRLKSSTQDLVEDILKDFDWGDMDDTWEMCSESPTTDSEESFETAFSSLSNKNDKEPGTKHDEPTWGNGRKRNLCRVLSLEKRSSSMSLYNIVDLASGCNATLQLEGVWNQQALPEKCLVNIVNVEMDLDMKYSVTRNQGYLIVEPDSLASVTLITHQLWCDREAVFKNIMQLFEGSIDTLRGNICHELLAKVLVERSTTIGQRKMILEEILKSSAVLHQAYALGIGQKELNALGAELLPFITKFVSTRRVSNAAHGEGQTWEIDKVRDIEDNYWNPVYGMKGKLDATIDIRKSDGSIKTIPMEVKTGNPALHGEKKSRIRDSHVGQVTLYSLLMSARYKDVTEGLLYYVREDNWQEFTMKSQSLQALIALRNNLVINSSSKFGKFEHLPEASADFDFKCAKCDYKNVCSLLIRKEDAVNYPISRTLTEQRLLSATSHLGEEELNFFDRWFKFITMEIEASEKPKHLANLWNLTSEERVHSCLPGLKLVKCWIPSADISLGYGKHYLAKFKAHGSPPNLSFVDFKEGDSLVIGTDDEVCVSHCVVYSIVAEPFSIVVSVESDLTGKSRNGIYNLDKTNFFNPSFIYYTYLVRLLEDTPAMKRLREYIILKKQSVIRPVKENAWTGHETFLKRYNVDQQRVILKSLSTDSFLFVKGMPGTGKTETIVGLLQLLVERGNTVLVVAYTSTAVDNIMLKYKEISNDFIRMGRDTHIREELKPHSYQSAIAGITDVDMLRSELKKIPIIASTMLSLNHEIFSNRSFDYAIIDETSQALPVACIGAILKANKYILFGDPEQLPPVIVSLPARYSGCEETLFGVMSTITNTTNLSIQYRMNGTIMNLANKLTYNNRMTCFSKDLENAYLNLPTEMLRKYILAITDRPRQIWITCVASKRLERSVIFLDTSEICAPDSLKNHSVKNNMEVTIAIECLKLFLSCGLDSNDVGVIAPYSAQVQALREAKNRLGLSCGEQSVEVNTVDQFQGRDKTVIICSFTKTKDGGGTSAKSEFPTTDMTKTSILNDKRRLNVAITRAKRKLILIGRLDFLKSYDPMQAMFDGLVAGDQVIHLQPEDVASLPDPNTPLRGHLMMNS